MAKNFFSNRLHDAIDNYYKYNPDTLMPLLMVALAAQGRLQLATRHDDGAVVLCEIIPEEVIDYDWVRLDSVLKKRIKEALATGSKTICIEGHIDSSLMNIYQTFYHYDTFTVEEEYHHRIGILYDHSSNKASEQAHRQYATICLAEALLAASKEWHKDSFLQISNRILEKSGLQPKRPRLKVAYALRTLLRYDGQGKVYNPFAGCAIAAAALNAGSNMYVDGDENDKLFAVAKLLNYGLSGSYEHYEQRDSTKWTDAGKFDYIMSTYRGYINGISAFDFCLSKCFDTLTESGKYAGIASPKDIFEDQSDIFKEALNRDWVETIALLPFGEVAVLINAKKDRSLKSKVRFFNLTHPMFCLRPVKILSDNNKADILRVSDIKKKGFLRSLVVPQINNRDGFEIVKLGDFIQKMKRKTFSLKSIQKEGGKLVSIDKRTTYDMYDRRRDRFKATPISSLFAPSYHLTGKSDCLIINNRGRLEPRIFEARRGTAFFQDGYAFKITEPYDENWLVTQLNEPYVLRQLHPYGMDEMVPEAISENQILNLKLYREIEEDNFSENEEEGDKDADKLPSGYELTGNKFIYTIHRFLDHGSFGFTYTALAKDLITGEEKEVVLKEFYPYLDFHREGEDLKAVPNGFTRFNINAEKLKFREEAKIMRKLGNTPDSHIVPAGDFFESEKTNTMYYVMPFYHFGSLADLQKSGFSFTEDLLVNNIVKPMCKALHLAHRNKVLHLDIKPVNILVDDNGYAVLTDFGIAKQYDEGGSIINRQGANLKGYFAAPEMRARGFAMVQFGSEPDIFGLAATLYYLATRCYPHPIQYNSDEDNDLRQNMEEENLSTAFIEAIIAGLQAAAPSRPRSAQAFLNMFPGCEDIKL